MSLIRTLSLFLAISFSTAGALDVTGVGASFPYPLYTKMFAEFKKTTGHHVNYRPIGSGAGRNQIIARTVDFGATDTPMSAEAQKKVIGKLIHIPTALGAVVAVYNLPGVTGNLNLNGPLLADIYLGKIKRWNDPALSKLNKGKTLPPFPITVVRRSDGSGTTGVFTDYLSKISPEWKKKIGSSTSVSWPAGVGARGNDGVAGVVKQTPGAIGYVESVYAEQNKINFALLQNSAGQFIKANPESVTAAAAAVTLPADTLVSITNAPGKNSYPLGSYTYILVYQDQKYGKRTQAQAQVLGDLLNYIVTTGQRYNEGLGYAKLPTNALTKAQALIRSLRFGDKTLR